MDEDEFGDDGLDTILDDSLLELEQRAISSTQRPKNNAVPPAGQKRIQSYGAPGLSRNRSTHTGNWRPPQPRQQSQPSIQNGGLSASATGPPSSDYGFDDEDVIDLDEPSMVIQPSSNLPTRARAEAPAEPGAGYGPKRVLDPETEAAYAAADAELGASRPGQWAQVPQVQQRANDGVDISALQARVAELEAEQARLRQLEDEARNIARQKQGEIAIVRANQEKGTKEYERRIAVMQKLHAEESAKQKAELEAGRKEREKMETDNRFLHHDLAQEAEKVKRLNGPGGARAAASGKENATPRKRSSTLGDGFEDEEVTKPSPSKTRDRDKSREQTPKVGAKRKRPAQDSPLPALSFNVPDAPANSDGGHHAQVELEGQGSAKTDGRYAFMQRLLNHSPYEGHERSVEALMKHAFPSDTGTSHSTKLMDLLSSPVATHDDHLPLKLSVVLLKLWSQCLEEKYYPPIYLMLDLIRFALCLEPASQVVRLLSEAVPICMRTIDLVANPTARASLYPAYASSTEYKNFQAETKRHVDVDEILDFLQLLCDTSSLNAETSELFWRNMEFTFVLLLLNKAQPISQITTALRMVSTSCLPTTFGPICTYEVGGTGERQSKQESDMIDRLTFLLFNMPEVPADEPAYMESEIVELRIEILSVLKALCLTDYGGLLLAHHRSAIGRLIRFLDSQITKLHNSRPSLGSDSGDNDLVAPHTLIARTINMAVRLVYHLLKTYDKSIDLQQKLRVVKGGYHKFLVSMTRLAFSDQLVLEAGIETEVVEAAHAVLDAVLSPEEGEAVMKALETPRGTSGSTTEKDSELMDVDVAMGMDAEPG